MRIDSLAVCNCGHVFSEHNLQGECQIEEEECVCNMFVEETNEGQTEYEEGLGGVQRD